MSKFASICTPFTYHERVKCAKIYQDEVLRGILGSLVKSRKNEVIPSCARENKSANGLLRQVSCTIKRTLANWGRVGHNVPQIRINTAVSTTKG